MKKYYTYRVALIVHCLVVLYRVSLVAQSPFVNSKQGVVLSNAQSGVAERWISLFTSASQSASYRLTFPTVAPSAGEFLNVQSIASSTATTQWVSPNDIIWTQTGNSEIDYANEFLGSSDTSRLVVRTNDSERVGVFNNGALIFSSNLGFTYGMSVLPTYGTHFSDIAMMIPTVRTGTASDLRMYLMDDHQSRFVVRGINDADIVSPGWGSELSTYVSSLYIESIGRIFVRGKLGIGSAPLNDNFSVSGSKAHNVTTYSSAGGTLTCDNTGHVYNVTGSPTITLPSASTCTRRRYVICNRVGSSRSISSYTTLSGTTSTSLSASTCIEVISDGTNWLQIR